VANFLEAAALREKLENVSIIYRCGPLASFLYDEKIIMMNGLS
jgi:hypothetical protein